LPLNCASQLIEPYNALLVSTNFSQRRTAVVLSRVHTCIRSAYLYQDLYHDRPVKTEFCIKRVYQKCSHQELVFFRHIKGKVRDTNTDSVDGGVSPIITLYHRHVCCAAAEPPSPFPSLHTLFTPSFRLRLVFNQPLFGTRLAI
jgi:hypothetical protein